MKKLLLILIALPIIGFGQNVNIPEPWFKQYLVGNTLINTNVTHFWSFNNSNLYCINVDNASFSTTNWTTHKDVQHYFSNNCSGTTSIQEHTTNKELLKVTDLIQLES